MERAIAITGRRPNSLPWGCDEYTKEAIALKNRLKYRISNLISKGYKTYYVGMAEGVDTYITEILIDFRYELRDIKINAVIPYKGFADDWSTFDRERYFKLLSQCDSVKVMADSFSKGAIFMRNEYMVDNADIVLAVYDNVENGGTYNTVMYAKSKGKKVIIEEI